MDAIRAVFEGAGVQYVDRRGIACALRSLRQDEEYRAIRSLSGISDRRDLTKVRVTGDGALAFLELVTTANIRDLREGGIRAALFLSETGSILTDAYVCCVALDEYLVISGSGFAPDLPAYLQGRSLENVRVDDESSSLSALSIEGPYAWRTVAEVIGPEVAGIRVLRSLRMAIGDVPVIIARIGATGEYGYMMLFPSSGAEAVVARVLSTASEAALCGLEIQDLLRLEVRGFNRDLDVPNGETPLQAGLHWLIDFRKPEYIGRGAVEQEKTTGLSQKLVGLVGLDDRIASIGDKLWASSNAVGYVVNAGFSPTISRGVALAYVHESFAWVGVELGIGITGPDGAVAIRSAPLIPIESSRVKLR